MEKYVSSADGENIHYRESGDHEVATVFVHGWLGDVSWWKNQEQVFGNDYDVVLIDLAGHGQSSRTRKDWSGEHYADDIVAVVHQLESKDVVLIGHSMSGAFVLEATRHLLQVKGVVLIDTLKDLDKTMTPEQAEQVLFSNYRNDFKNAVEKILPQYLFVEQTPDSVRERLQSDFLGNEATFAINSIAGLYEMDVRSIAKEVDVPVRAINSDYSPVSLENNRKYFKDYDYSDIGGTGHYPMLENPQKFNDALQRAIVDILDS